MRTLIDRWRLFSLRESAVHRGRTLASVAVMTVSAAFLVAVFGIFGSLTGSVHRLVDGLAGAATLEVSGITDSGFPATVRAETAAVPGVAAAVPMVRSVVPTSAGQTLVLGTDAGATALASVLQPAVESQLGALVSVPDGVLAGPGLGLATGERLGIGNRSVTVAGVLTGGELGRLNEGHYVLTSLAVAQRALGRADRLDSVLIVTEPGADESAVRAGVEQVVAGRAVVAEPTLRAVRTGNGLRILQYMTLMGAALAFIVAAFLIYTAMSMAIAQRRHTLSMLRAIGGRRRTLAADLLAEAAVIGLLGGAAGAVLGILYGRTAIDALPVALVQSVEARTAYSLPLYAIPLALAASVITGVARPRSPPTRCTRSPRSRRWRRWGCRWPTGCPGGCAWPRPPSRSARSRSRSRWSGCGWASWCGRGWRCRCSSAPVCSPAGRSPARSSTRPPWSRAAVAPRANSPRPPCAGPRGGCGPP
ncbi:ABC transporter permease [Nocardia farcinica]|uniref:ABC transporter permease n=2 Tax=Nocardia farcinica TaxID=37329 RepID=UPI001E50B1EF|nr:FtsX-like permease family protein [Nocardia farcinica]